MRTFLKQPLNQGHRTIKVSLVIPVYNVSNYIEDCLASVISQTYDNIECIIVDDCSTDDSVDKARHILADYQGPIRFVVLKHDQNKGLSEARNTGIRRTTGDYLYFLDSDDRITPDCIALLVSCLDGGREVDVVQGFWNENGTDRSRKELAAGEVLHIYDKEEIRRKYYWEGYPVTAWNKLIRRSFIIRNNLFFKPGIYHEDVLWLYYLAKAASSLAICNVKTYIYNYSIGSITRSREKKRIEERFVSICYIIADMQDDMTREKIYREYRAFVYSFYLYCIVFFYVNKRYDLYFRFVVFVLRRMLRKGGANDVYDVFFYLNLLPPLCFLLKWKRYRKELKKRYGLR